MLVLGNTRKVYILTSVYSQVDCTSEDLFTESYNNNMNCCRYERYDGKQLNFL
jgi:hypothetical protein